MEFVKKVSISGQAELENGILSINYTYPVSEQPTNLSFNFTPNDKTAGVTYYGIYDIVEKKISSYTCSNGILSSTDLKNVQTTVLDKIAESPESPAV